ncbi:MAG TPA: hypothetical protein PLE77_08825 [Kiritimatiellia bacterium]|nr:hypothetical protein [Kiritimatiellia bacterium]
MNITDTASQIISMALGDIIKAFLVWISYGATRQLTANDVSREASKSANIVAAFKWVLLIPVMAPVVMGLVGLPTFLVQDHGHSGHLYLYLLSLIASGYGASVGWKEKSQQHAKGARGQDADNPAAKGP